mmetsp:Transcript_12927/g.25282  ORF Transcript_12927/g.25282 Transcript_12927/m.25282 type:complete len:281 (+) Transcript_12927:449-1291(+)
MNRVWRFLLSRLSRKEKTRVPKRLFLLTKQTIRQEEKLKRKTLCRERLRNNASKEEEEQWKDKRKFDRETLLVCRCAGWLPPLLLFLLLFSFRLSVYISLSSGTIPLKNRKNTIRLFVLGENTWERDQKSQAERIALLPHSLFIKKTLKGMHTTTLRNPQEEEREAERKKKTMKRSKRPRRGKNKFERLYIQVALRYSLRPSRHTLSLSSLFLPAPFLLHLSLFSAVDSCCLPACLFPLMHIYAFICTALDGRQTIEQPNREEGISSRLRASVWLINRCA